VSSKDRFSPFEFGLVICTAFGWYILSSVFSLIFSLTQTAVESSGSAYGDSHLLGVVLYEALITPALLAMLYARGWRVADLRLGVSAGATVLGIGICLAAYLVDGVIDAGLRLVFPFMQSDAEGIARSAGPALVSVVLLSIVNPVFEEVFVAGYVIEALRQRFGVTTAINVSVVIRASYHLYQGVPAFPFHAAYGLLQGYAFVRYGRLWPLIVSHALLDFFAFA
jgi:membrane protease YdiL (CAAX protease family)